MVNRDYVHGMWLKQQVFHDMFTDYAALRRELGFAIDTIISTLKLNHC